MHGAKVKNYRCLGLDSEELDQALIRLMDVFYLNATSSVS
jgi:hypothetical protein